MSSRSKKTCSTKGCSNHAVVDKPHLVCEECLERINKDVSLCCLDEADTELIIEEITTSGICHSKNVLDLF